MCAYKFDRFDILSFGFDSDEDEKGMIASRDGLSALIRSEVDSGTPASRIVLGGFSQGAAMSLLAGLTAEPKLGGIACLSGWLPLRHKFKEMATENAKNLPIFWGHGTADPLVQFTLGRMSADFLIRELGVKAVEEEENAADVPVGLSFHGYVGLVHGSNEAELDDLRDWLKRVLPKTSA